MQHDATPKVNTSSLVSKSVLGLTLCNFRSTTLNTGHKTADGCKTSKQDFTRTTYSVGAKITCFKDGCNRHKLGAAALGLQG